MSHDDNARFNRAAETPPEIFHAAVLETLSGLEEKKHPRFAKKGVLLAALITVLFVGTAIAVVSGMGLNSFMDVDFEALKLPVVSEFAVEGEMELMDVNVLEAATDGAFLMMTVEFSLKDPVGKAIIFDYEVDYLNGLAPPEPNNPSMIDLDKIIAANTVYCFSLSYKLSLPNRKTMHFIGLNSHRYTSPTSVLLFIKADIRGEDNAAYALDNLTVDFTPKLHVFDPGRIRVLKPDASFTSYNFDDYYPKAEQAGIRVTMANTPQASRYYTLADCPPTIGNVIIKSATCMETPLAYYFNFDMFVEGSVDQKDINEFFVTLKVLNAENESLVLGYGDRYIGMNRDSDFIKHVETVCLKPDVLEATTLELCLKYDDDTVQTASFPFNLVPIE